MIRIILIVALAMHSTLSAVAIHQGGYFGAFPPFQDIWTYQIFSDLVVATGILWLFLYREAKAKNRPLWRVWVCGFGILASGSISPLIYLLIHKDVLEDLGSSR